MKNPTDKINRQDQSSQTTDVPGKSPQKISMTPVSRSPSSPNDTRR
jgi:hypothetical protein